MDVWELSKENIQPLVSGRQMTSLQAALTPIPDEITQKQNQYEHRLRLYAGNDELAIWHEYILWAEQSFPQGGKMGNFDQLLCQCVKRFQNETRYYNDDRFVSVLLKYIKKNSNKLEVFQQMEVRGVGLKSARFYCEWAWQLEQYGDYKRANELLIQAIYQGAEPKESLLSMQKNIAYKLANKLNSSDKNDGLISSLIPETAENRQVLSGLQPVGKKHRAPANRVPALTDPSKVKQQPLKANTNVKSTKFQVFSDDVTSEPSKPRVIKNRAPSALTIPKLDEQVKENEQTAGKWRNVKVSQGDKKVVPVPVGEAMGKHPGFNVHTDDDNQSVSGTPKVLSGACGILKLKSVSSKPQKTAFDPPTPNKICKYNHALVYGGAKEMSFEEIRAASWSLKQQQIEEAKALARKKEEEYKKTIDALRVENDYMKQQLLLMSSCSSQASSSKNTPESLSFPRLNSQNSSSLFKDCNQSFKSGSKKISPNKSVTHDVFNLWNATIGVRSKNSTFEDSSLKNPPTPDNLCKLNNNAAVQKLEPKLGFQVFEDCESPSHKLKIDSGTLSRETRAEAKGNFVVFEDPEDKSLKPKAINGFQVHCDEPEDDFKENISPSIVNHDEKKRPLAGILVESQNVHFVPLEEQEDTDDDDSEEEELARPLEEATKTENYTIYQEECGTSSKMSSTPFPFAQRVQAAPIFPIDDGFTIALETAKTVAESSEREEFIPPQTKETKKNVLNEQKTNRMSLGVGLSPIMERSREQSKSSSSSGYATSHGSTLGFGAKSIGKSGIFKPPNNSIVAPGLPLEIKTENKEPFNSVVASRPLEIKTENEEPIKTKLSQDDVFLTTAYKECLRAGGGLIQNLSGYSSFETNLPTIICSKTVKLGESKFKILSSAGKGSSASVYKAIDEEDDKIVALKLNLKSNEWEFYITSELQKRLGKLDSPLDVRDAVLHYHKGYFFKNGSVLISEYSSMGSLLDLVNTLKMEKIPMVESLVFYLTWELMRVLEQLHKCKIIHADIKPDNILLMNLPDSSNLSFTKVSCLCLIDFDQAIDLDMYDEGITFNKKVFTDAFQCPEMLENRPWTFQSDLYCLLACVHVMLFSKYMKIVKNKTTNLWETSNKIKRYWKQTFWNKFFETFLNIPSCDQIPPLAPFIEEIESYLTHPVYVAQLEAYLVRIRKVKL